MDEKILIAFDDSTNAMRAVEHVARFLNTSSKITLFSVLEDTATLFNMNSPELTAYFLAQQESFEALEEKRKGLVDEALEKAKVILLNAGFPEEHIRIKTQYKKEGIARDIINEAEDGYDLIVMGRRGLSGIKEFLIGSVSNKVLHSIKDVSTLIVN